MERIKHNPCYAFVFVVVMMLQCSFAQEVHAQIQLRLTLRKANLVTGELIYVRVALVNTSSQVQSVPDPASETSIKFILKDENGTFLSEEWSLSHNIGRPPVVEISSRDSIVFFTSPRYFGNAPTWTGVARDFLPGRYTLSIRLGTIESQEVAFNVRERSPEEFEVYRRIALADISARPSEKAIDECRRLIRECQNSVYMPNVYALLMSHLLSAEQFHEAKSVALEFIEQFPEHGVLERATDCYRTSLLAEYGVAQDALPSEAQLRMADNELRRLKPKSKNPILAYFVDDSIRRYKKWWMHMNELQEQRAK